ncbi:MAG: sulfatase-like hydrolase/transferase, partial [Bacteroidales bacterium]|nr:sulfatase-like hydrolase/transferase [Bacteroidales bacterium]
MKQLTVLVCLFTYLLSAAQTPESPNFIIILTDDQGWASTSTLMDPNNPDSKSDYYVTPNMDALFDNSIVFSQGYAPGAYCIPSRRSIQTGQSAARITFNTRDKQVRGEEYASTLSLPRVLKAANPDYVTAHFGKWHLENDYADPGVMGYDRHDGDTTNAEGDPDEPGTPEDQPDLYPFIQKDPKKVFSLTDRTNHFMEEQVKAGKPFFVQLSHYAVHLDMASTQESLDRALEAPIGQKHVIPPFKAMMEDMDNSIGQLLAKVEELGIMDNTYIIFTSDNGFRKDIVATGYEDYVASQTTNYPLTGAKHTHTEGGIRVPFSISGPGIAKGIYSNVPVSSLDLLPTFAEIAGYTGQLADIDGGSLKDVLENNGSGTITRPNDFFVIHGEKRSAMIRGEYKLYVDFQTSAVQLFKPAEDASELNDLATTEPAILNEMKALFDNYLTDVDGVNDGSTIGDKVHITKTADPEQSMPV